MGTFISGLNASSSFSDADEFIVDQENETVKMSLGQLKQHTGASVNSIDELKNLAGAIDDQAVNVLGYYEAGDGGGGTFYWQADSEETNNDGTIIQATGVTTGRWKRMYSGAVNVKWFGAKGDNSTDDTDAIQAALDYLLSQVSEDELVSSRCFIPAGNYKCAGLINSGPTSIKGEGLGSRLILNDNTKSIITQFHGNSSLFPKHSGPFISDITLEGNLLDDIGYIDPADAQGRECIPNMLDVREENGEKKFHSVRNCGIVSFADNLRISNVTFNELGVGLFLYSGLFSDDVTLPPSGSNSKAYCYSGSLKDSRIGRCLYGVVMWGNPTASNTSDYIGGWHFDGIRVFNSDRASKCTVATFNASGLNFTKWIEDCKGIHYHSGQSLRGGVTKYIDCWLELHTSVDALNLDELAPISSYLDTPLSVVRPTLGDRVKMVVRGLPELIIDSQYYNLISAEHSRVTIKNPKSNLVLARLDNDTVFDLDRAGDHNGVGVVDTPDGPVSLPFNRIHHVGNMNGFAFASASLNNITRTEYVEGENLLGNWSLSGGIPNHMYTSVSKIVYDDILKRRVVETSFNGWETTTRSRGFGSPMNMYTYLGLTPPTQSSEVYDSGIAFIVVSFKVYATHDTDLRVGLTSQPADIVKLKAGQWVEVNQGIQHIWSQAKCELNLSVGPGYTSHPDIQIRTVDHMMVACRTKQEAEYWWSNKSLPDKSYGGMPILPPERGLDTIDYFYAKTIVADSGRLSLYPTDVDSYYSSGTAWSTGAIDYEDTIEELWLRATADTYSNVNVGHSWHSSNRDTRYASNVDLSDGEWHLIPLSNTNPSNSGSSDTAMADGTLTTTLLSSASNMQVFAKVKVRRKNHFSY